MSQVLPWKDEPVSPLSSEEASLLDDPFYQSLPDDVKLENDHFLDCESKAEVASYILENLEKLVDLDELIKAESSFFLDDKMLPLLDEVEPPRGAVAVPVPLKAEYYKSPEENTTYLLDFEKVYYELNHGTLTPPQSPPSEHPVITTLEPSLGANNYLQIPNKEAYVTVPEKPDQLLQPPKVLLGFSPVSVIQNIPPVVNHNVPSPVINNFASAPTPQPDIDHELAVVDEIVRNTVEDMQWNSSPSSPESSSNSNFGDCSSDDPEWVPQPIENYNDTSFSPVQKSSKKRSKPYSPDDKKNRKKEQNKNAATRYRLKKKAEVEEILNEEKQLLDKHSDLNTQITDLQREIKYLKGLMRDLFKAKGLIN